MRKNVKNYIVKKILIFLNKGDNYEKKIIIFNKNESI